MNTIGESERTKMAARSEAVFAYLDGFVRDAPVPEKFRALLEVQLDVGREHAEDHPLFPAVQLPMLVAARCGMAEADAVPVAAACTLVYLGADLLDNALDAELAPAWERKGARAAVLTGATYLAALIPLAVARISSAGAELHEVFARGLLEMSVGQMDDLDRAAATTETCRVVAERKSGGEFELFARAAALAAGASPQVVSAYAGMGRALGAATQIASDVGDLWRGPQMDLINGTKTLPVVHALATLRGAELKRLLRDLDEAKRSRAARTRVLMTLRDAGSLRFSLLVCEVYKQRALRLAEQLPAHDEPADDVRAYLGSIGILATPDAHEDRPATREETR